MKTENCTITRIAVVLALALLGINGYAMDPPIAHWTFDEAEGEIAEDVAGDRDGTWVGNIVWQPEAGYYGGAIQCEDDSSFIIVDDTDMSLFDELGTMFTVSVWVAVFEFTQDWQGIIFKNDKFFLERNNSGGSGTVNGIHFKAKDEDGSQPFNLYGNITIDDGEWHHIVGIYDDTFAFLYVDGELDVEGSADGNMVGLTPDPLVIGAKIEGTYRNSWNGLIDDVKFFNYALSADQVDSLYTMEMTAIKAKYGSMAPGFALKANYPNPFNPSTQITFTIPKTTLAQLNVYNVRGELVRNLLNEQTANGMHTLTWDGRNSNGQNVPSGVYVYELTTDEFSQMRKMALMR